MNSLFVIAEIGECKEYSTNEQLSKLLYSYLSQIGIISEDTYLITAKGEKIPFELLSSNNNNNTGTIFAYCQINHYELFQQVLINDIITKRYSINFTSASNLLSEDKLNKKCLKTIEALINELLSFESFFDSIVTNNSIEATYNQIIDTYVSYNDISTAVSSSMNQIKKIKENISYMQKAKKLLLTHFNSIIPQLSVAKKSMERKEEEINERIKQSDMSYRNYLEIKSKELNQCPQQDFEENGNKEKLIDSKATFVKKFLYIRSKIKEKNQLLAQHIDKITKGNIHAETKSNHKDIDLINKTYEQLSNEKSKYKKNKIYDDLLLFQNKCQTVLNEFKSNQPTILTAKSIVNLNEIKSLKSKYDGLYPLPSLLEQAEDKVSQFKEILKRMIMTNSQFIIEILDSIKVLLTLQTKYKSYEQFLSLIEADINEFDLITQGAKQYNEYCDEIYARLSFNRSINQSIKELKHSVQLENERRRKFNKLKGEAMEKMININNSNHHFNIIKNSNKESKDELKLIIDFVNDSDLYQSYSQSAYEGREHYNIKQQANDVTEFDYSTLRLIKEKDNQIKQMTIRCKKREEQILNYQNEVDKISKTIEALSDDFVTQAKELNEQIKEKDGQISNLSTIINENTFGTFINCPMCKDAGMNSVDYQMWSGYVKELNAKLNKKTRDHSNMQLKYNETINHLFIIKKTLFNHLNQVISKKNEELISEREYYENVILHLEDLLSNHSNRNV